MIPDEIPTLSIHDLISGFSPEIQLLTLRIQSLILTLVPVASEKVNSGWRSISYKHPGVGYFCGIFPNEDYVDLIFEFGILLEDPEKILMGEGSQVRYVRMKNIDDVLGRQLEVLITAAVNLPESRSVRMQMVKSGAKQILQSRDRK